MLTQNNLNQPDADQQIAFNSAWDNESDQTLPQTIAITVAKFVARLNPYFWMALDLVLAVLAIRFSYILSPKATGFEPTLFQTLFFPAALLISGHVSGLYERIMLRRRTQLFIALFSATLISVFALVLSTNLIFYEVPGRWILFYSGFVYFICALVPRIAAFYLVQFYRIRILLVGDAGISSIVAKRINKEKYHVKLIGACSEMKPEAENNIIGAIDDIPKICQKRHIDEIIIANEYLNHPQVLQKCFEASQSGCALKDECGFYEEFFEQVPVDHIDESWFFRSRINLNYRYQMLLKRSIDILLSIVGLLMFLPIFPIMWIILKLCSKGPFFYSQIRCGQYGKPFWIYKIRTMHIDSEVNGAQWAKSQDDRVFPFGKFLRKTRLDEFPQFWNVFKGDMAIVGPRPERPELVEKIEQEVPFFSFRHWARPGITGLAQIRFKYGASIKHAKVKLQHDLFYIKNWSLILDIRIILRTFAKVMRGSR